MQCSFLCCLIFLVIPSAAFATTQDLVRVGKYPDFVAVNSLTNVVYAANSGDGTVSVIDGASNTVTATITVGGQPQGIAVNPETNRIYAAVFSGLSSTLAVIDGNSNEVVASIPDPGATFISLNTATNRIYTSDSDNTVRVIEGMNNTVAATISFNNVVESLAVDVTRNRVYVAVESSPPSVAVINGEGNSVINTIALPEAQFVPGLAVDSSLNRLYAACNSNGNLMVINAATGTVLKRISLPGEMNPKYTAMGLKHQVLVADPGANRVFFINGNTGTVSGSSAFKAGPWGLRSIPAMGIFIFRSRWSAWSQR